MTQSRIRRSRAHGSNMSTLTRRHATRRSGKTLIEMIVIITTGSLLVSLSAGLFHEMAQTDRLFRDATTQGAAKMRLARTFRRDVRAARSVQILNDEKGSRLRLSTKAGTVSYISTKEGIRRKRQQDTETFHDLFRLGPVKMTFEQTDGLVVFSVSPRQSPRPNSRAGDSLRIVAAVGADVFHNATSRPQQPQPVRAPRPPVRAPRPQGERP